MHAEGYAREYAKAQVTSVDRSRLLLLVLDGGATFLRQAREGLASGELERFGNALGRAQAIIGELRGTLDHEAGGKIATDLARLYDFMLFHLTEANAKKSVQHVDDVIGIYETIAEAFHQVIERPAVRQKAVA
jgi:flagellar protein FliS